MTAKKIYLASSWRNVHQPGIVTMLRSTGFEVYDFRNPQSGGPPVRPSRGFTWREIDPNWNYDRENILHKYRRMLKHPAAQAGFEADFDAMKWADICVIALPCGRSAHLEAGWMAGAGKKLVVYMPPAVCTNCNGRGILDKYEDASNLRQKCLQCADGLLWNFEPELMYLIGGEPDNILAFNTYELLQLLREEEKGEDR